MGTLTQVGIIHSEVAHDIEKSDTKDFKENFQSILNKLTFAKIIELSDIFESFDENHLHMLHFIDQAQFNKKRIRVNTKNNYEQQKYNLLREENEGYSKLLIEILNEESINSESLDIISSNITSLIGHFDLDPNRVLDLTIKAFETNPFNECYLQIIRILKVDAIKNILTFRLNSKCSEETIKESTYLVVAQLIKAKIISIEDIWSSLQPSEKEFEEQYLSKFDIAFKLYKENYIVKLTQDADGKKNDKENREKMMIEFNKSHTDNQKLSLMNALVKLNVFWEFERLVVIYKPILDISMHHELLDSLCMMVEWILDPVLDEFNPSKHLKRRNKRKIEFPCDDSGKGIEQFKLENDYCFDSLFRVLKVLGAHVGYSANAFVKVCRFLKYLVLKRNIEIDSKIKEILGKVLLPAICYFSSNSTVATEFWTLFNLLPHLDRYKFYEEFIINTNFSIPKLILNSSKVLKKTMKWLNRLSKDKLKHNSRSLGKFSHNNPFVVFHEFVKRVKSLFCSQKDIRTKFQLLSLRILIRQHYLKI